MYAVTGNVIIIEALMREFNDIRVLRQPLPEITLPDRFIVPEPPRMVMPPEYRTRARFRNTASPYRGWRSRMRRAMERKTHQAQRRRGR